MPTVEQIARLLDITEDEAREVVKADEAIDHGAKLFELTDEQKQAAKKYKNAGTRTAVDAYGKKRERQVKPHPEKREAVALMVQAFQARGHEVNISNEEREFFVNFGAKRFKVTLSEPRS